MSVFNSGKECDLGSMILHHFVEGRKTGSWSISMCTGDVLREMGLTPVAYQRFAVTAQVQF